MNVEMIFVKTEAVTALIDIIRKRLKSAPDPVGQQPDWGLPSSYDVVLANEKKRKIAISPSIEGWVSVVESKESIDFALAQLLSEELRADVVAVQLYEVTGSYGYARRSNGVMCESIFDEEGGEDPSGAVSEYIKRNGIVSELWMFREAVHMRSQGWIVV